MKLLHAASITATTSHESKDARRIDFLDWKTGEYPPDIGDGQPEDIVARIHYDGTETLEIERAATDMNAIDVLEHNGKTYRVIEATRPDEYGYYGFWESIKCVRSLEQ